MSSGSRRARQLATMLAPPWPHGGCVTPATERVVGLPFPATHVGPPLVASRVRALRARLRRPLTRRPVAKNGLVIREGQPPVVLRQRTCAGTETARPRVE